MNQKRYMSKALAILLAFLMVFTTLPQTAFGAEGIMKGSGTAEDPYQIEDAADLKAFRDRVNGQTSSTLCATLTKDIDLSLIHICCWTTFTTWRSG